MISAEELLVVFVEVADTLVADFDAIEFMNNFCERAASICDAKAVGILLADEHGKLSYIASSTEKAGLVELLEMQISEGPCYESFREHRQVISPDLEAVKDQWPHYAPRAVEAGFASVHAIPLRLGKQTIGAINIFGDQVGRFEAANIRTVQALADVATICILQGRSVQRAEAVTSQLQQALFGRIAVEQAKGALSKLHGVNPDQAFTLMRAYAREKGLRLGHVARAVIEDPDSVPTLTKPS